VSGDDLNDYLMTAPRRWGSTVPPITCRDGFTMSVQASSAHYSIPRGDTGPWAAVEVGFPNRIEPLLWPWVEGGGHPADWCDAVYPFVPVAVVAAVVELHGGLGDPAEG
jgi:hypothetical protein